MRDNKHDYYQTLHIKNYRKMLNMGFLMTLTLLKKKKKGVGERECKLNNTLFQNFLTGLFVFFVFWGFFVKSFLR